MGGRGSGGARSLEPEFCLLALAVCGIRTASKENAIRFKTAQGRLDNFIKPRRGIMIGLGWSLQLLSSLGLMMPLGYDHRSRRFIQSYHARVDSMAINAAPRRREWLIRQSKHYKHKNGIETAFVGGVSGTAMGGQDGLFSRAVTCVLVTL